MIQCLENVFISHHFVHVLCCCLMLNRFKLLFFLHINLHSIHHIDKAKTELSQLPKFITKLNNEISTLHKYSLIKYFSEAPLQSQVFFVWWDKLFWSAFGNYLLFFSSSPLKVFQVRWGQTHIFRFIQKYLIGFKLRLWLGHSRTSTELSVSHSCCVLWKVNLLPSLRFWMVWTGFLLRLLLIVWCIELFFYSEESLGPCCWKTAPHHEAATSTLYFWDATVQEMSSAGFLQTWCLDLRFIKTDNIISHCLSVL